MKHAHTALARERLIADLRSLVHDSEDLLKATAGEVSEKAKEARSRLTFVLKRAQQTCENLQEKTAASARVAAKKADIMIREHPYECLAISFGIGLLIGVLVTRKQLGMDKSEHKAGG